MLNAQRSMFIAPLHIQKNTLLCGCRIVDTEYAK